MFDGILLVVIGCALIKYKSVLYSFVVWRIQHIYAAANWGELENWSIRIDYQDLILQSALEVEHG